MAADRQEREVAAGTARRSGACRRRRPCRRRSRSGTRSPARRRTRPARRGRAARPPPAFQSPAEWSARTIVTFSPAASTVPPLFIPISRVGPPGSSAAEPQAHLVDARPGRPRAGCATARASPKWSSWPWVTSSTSHRSTASAERGLSGLPNHGSKRIVLPPGVVPPARMAVPGERRVARSSAIGAPPRRSQRSALRWRRAGGHRSGRLGYTRAVPAERIAENLAFINWTVLTGLAFGLVRGGRPGPPADRRDPRLPRVHRRVRGRARWSSPSSSDQALPAASRRLAVLADPALDVPRRVALLAFCRARRGLHGRARPSAAGRRRWPLARCWPPVGAVSRPARSAGRGGPFGVVLLAPPAGRSWRPRPAASSRR